jgi:hypothetical protein
MAHAFRAWPLTAVLDRALGRGSAHALGERGVDLVASIDVAPIAAVDLGQNSLGEFVKVLSTPDSAT